MNYQINESNKQQRKHSLENNDLMTKLKKRRHISPKYDNHTISLSTKRKLQKRSLENNSTIRTKTNRQTCCKSSSRQQSFSIEYLTEITLPNWERISPNINKILSIKHTQSGVYAHEINLVQQELEALLSMSMIRDNILKNLLHPTLKLNTDIIQSNIYQHQQAENIYSSKKFSKKPLLSLINHEQYTNPHILIDRQVSIIPIINSNIDKIWLDINTFFHKISSNDILIIENLIKFNHKFEEKIQQYKNDYQNNHLTQLNIIEQLNEENFNELLNITQINPVITHYINRTIIERFQTKFYEYTSLENDLNNQSSLRISPRLHSNNQISLSSLPNLKSDDNQVQPTLLKSKNKTKIKSINPSSSIKYQENIQLVHDYLTDQHPLINEELKQQLSCNIKTNKKQKKSVKIHNHHCTDIFQSKLSTLITLLHESSLLSLRALKRARLQFNNEHIWQKLNTIEHDLELLIEKIDMTSDDNNSISTEKTFQTLDNLLNDWDKYEDDFNHQFE